MRVIVGTLSEELVDAGINPKYVDSSKPFPVSTYRKLVEIVAKLAYWNMDNLLFYRGQSVDFLNKAGGSTLYPTIYRGEYIKQNEINERFKTLYEAAKQLKAIFKGEKIDGHREVARKKHIQWSILQHYQVCATPLIDLTHSLRVACSFAHLEKNQEYGYVYVLGMPYITNRISINSEHDIVNVRLLSICPPDALRPYFQEGYLAGTEDITSEYETKTELDFKNRLIAKFMIPNDQTFWGDSFSKIPKNVLFPDDDIIEDICKSIKATIFT